MPQLETVHVKTTLTNVAVAYFQEPDIYIGDNIVPLVRSNKPSDYYFTYGREHFNLVDAVRRPGTTPVEVEHTVSKDQYVCLEYTMREKVTQEETEAADNPLEPEADAARYTSERQRLSREYRVATLMRDTNNYQAGFFETLNSESQFDNEETSEPVKKIQYALDKVAAEGKQCNTLWMGYPVWSVLRHHIDIINRLPGNAAKIVDTNFLKRLWEELDQILIGAARYNSAAEGASETLEYAWGKDLGLCYANTRMPNKKVPSFAYTFVWPYSVQGGRIRRDDQPGAANGTIYQGRTYPHADPGARSTWVEVGMREGMKIVGPKMAYLIKNAVG